VALCALVVWGSASAEQRQPAPEAAQAESRPYGGVTLAGGAPPLLKQPPAGLQYVTWPGFRADKKLGAEVFLQLTGPVTYQLKSRGRRVFVTLENVENYLENNLKPVPTKHFPGPVQRFRLRELKGEQIRLEIQLSRRVKPTVSLVKKQPYTYLVVHFPPR
jgi:hypothetical protein